MLKVTITEPENAFSKNRFVKLNFVDMSRTTLYMSIAYLLYINL